jgi:Protein-L-isoaspartate carboxylmethyltransferase
MNKDTKEFIAQNINANVHNLALQSSRFPAVDMPLAIRQINGKQKIKSKIPAFFDNEEVLYPVQLSLEQSSSESTAKYKSTLCEGNKLVDLTGGFGVDSFFLSARFQTSCYVERNEELCSLAKHNFKSLGRENIEVINVNSEIFLSEMAPVDWIFIDPARRSESGKKVVLLSDCEPDVSALSTTLLRKAKNVLIKLSPMMDVSAALRELPNTAEVHIISVDNECKEILLVMDQEKHNTQLIRTVNLSKNKKTEYFDFHSEEEQPTVVSLATQPEKYLYEPNSAILKSGAFKLIAHRFNLHKLHKNTHLYTSSELSLDFPGRIFEVQKTHLTGKKELKILSETTPKANISTRNFPMGADELRKKLKIKEGGKVYLFACTLADETKCIIECCKYLQE